jgi:hypothetical protein
LLGKIEIRKALVPEPIAQSHVHRPLIPSLGGIDPDDGRGFFAAR